MNWRITYAPPTDDALRQMPDRDRFEATMKATVGSDPYGHGSTQVGKDRDRREATVAGAIIRYYVSGVILTVTVVRLIPRP